MSLSPPADPELRRLLRALSLSERYHLYLVECGSAAALGSLVAALEQELSQLRGAPVTVVRLSAGATVNTPAPEQLIEQVLGPLLNPPSDRRTHGTVHILDITSGRLVDAASWALLFGRLNERRNEVQKRLAGELIVVLPPSYMPLFAIHAPDVWSTRSGSYLISDQAQEGVESSPETEPYRSMAPAAERDAEQRPPPAMSRAPGLPVMRSAHTTAPRSLSTFGASAKAAVHMLVSEYGGERYEISSDATPAQIASMADQLRTAVIGPWSEEPALFAVKRMLAVADWLVSHSNAEAEYELRRQAVRLARQLVIVQPRSASRLTQLRDALSALSSSEAMRGWTDRANGHARDVQQIEHLLTSLTTDDVSDTSAQAANASATRTIGPETDARQPPRIDALHLSAMEQNELCDAVRAAFERPGQLDAAIAEHFAGATLALRGQLEGDSSGQAADAAFGLVQWAAAFGRLLDVAKGVFAERPGHPLVRRFAETIGLAPCTDHLRIGFIPELAEEFEEFWTTLASTEAAVGRLVTGAHDDGAVTAIDEALAITAVQAVQTASSDAEPSRSLNVAFAARWTAAGILNAGQVDAQLATTPRTDLALLRYAGKHQHAVPLSRRWPAVGDMLLALDQQAGGAPSWKLVGVTALEGDNNEEPLDLRHGGRIRPGTPLFDLELALLAIQTTETRAAIVPINRHGGYRPRPRIRLQQRVQFVGLTEPALDAIRAVTDLLVPDGWVTPSSDRDRCLDFQLRVNGNNEYELADDTGESLAWHGPPAPIDGAGSAIIVASRLEHIARYRAALSLVHQSPALRCSASVGIADANNRHQERVQQAGSFVLPADALVSLHTSNPNPHELYVSWIHFTPDWQSRLFIHSRRLDPGKTMIDQLPVTSFPTRYAAEHKLKVLVSATPHDFGWLAFGPIDGEAPRPSLVERRFLLTPLLSTFISSTIPLRYRMPFVAPRHDWSSADFCLLVNTG